MCFDYNIIILGSKGTGNAEIFPGTVETVKRSSAACNNCQNDIKTLCSLDTKTCEFDIIFYVQSTVFDLI